ncbi:MAG TPA: flavodoxin family protein [Bacillota bacterium]|nr:flavodoxin family protein [Bacillota bacterium]
MKILAIVGSFRKEGNTDQITDAVLQGALEQGWETEKLFVDDLQFGSCQGCMECRKEGICCQQDDVAELVKKIDGADAVVFGSPIYGNYITGQAKMLLDRLMGVINKTIFVPGKGPVKVSRLQEKKRNVLILLTIGADRPESGDDPAKLLRRMLGSFTNGGCLEDLRATGVMDKGQVKMSLGELEQIARRMHPSANGEEKARAMAEKNQEILCQAYELGKKLTQ